MDKHTPASWSSELTEHGFYRITDAHGGEIAVTSGRDGAGEEEANARLIAAAPDLLERASDLVAVLSDFEGDYSDPAFIESLQLLADETRAAIAKAEGAPTVPDRLPDTLSEDEAYDRETFEAEHFEGPEEPPEERV